VGIGLVETQAVAVLAVDWSMLNVGFAENSRTNQAKQLAADSEVVQRTRPSEQEVDQ
jgi:hypothetical protein